MKEKENKKQQPAKNDPYGCDTPKTLDIQASSCGDCTGAVPALPQSEAEFEAANETFSFMNEANVK